ncbi:YihY/virulence factor BrkB family protein [Solimonas sp. SE-A11]|uniref:YihY/virulence factor BrkB family protein n=1 Tax=Solimonas sp. SE-A11 TaxID=3054954 RepID=UPI00259CE170|nr:YihY/virulence factor BrkB family protein [Solimonas sp. SE-A11]MDM4768995.1 YihY/virulence factor BrkB family protein [Solimonas sp. SE-A11]
MHRQATEWLGALKDAASRWNEDRNATQAAALAFYSAFSLAPTLVIVIAVAGAVFGREAAEGRLYAEIASLMGRDGASIIQTMVANAWKADSTGSVALASMGAIIVGASATFAQLRAALNQVWNIRPPDTPLLADLLALLKTRLLSFGLVMGMGFLLLVLLVMDAALGFALDLVWGEREKSYWLLNLLRTVVALALMSLAFAALIRELPDGQPRWRDVLRGALVAALMFSFGKHLFGLYLARAGTADTFGAAGSLAVILMWLYFSAAVFLFGAQVAAALGRAEQSGEASPLDTTH